MAEVKALTKEAILGKNDLQIKAKEVPEWGGTIFIKMMSGKERESLETDFQNRRLGKEKMDVKNMRVGVIVDNVVDENGEKIFSKNEISALNEKSSKVLNEIFDEILSYNGLGKEGLEEAEKN